MALLVRFAQLFAFTLTLLVTTANARASTEAIPLPTAARDPLLHGVGVALIASSAPLEEIVRQVPDVPLTELGGAKHYGFTDKTFVGTFRLRNDTDRAVRRYLELGTPTTDRIALRVGGEAPQLGGLLVPRTHHTVVARVPTFRIDVPPNDTVEVVFALRGEGQIHVLTNLYTPEGLVAESAFQGVSRGLLLGAVFLLAFYSLALFFFTQRRTHALYFWSVMGWVTTVAVFDGTLRALLPVGVDLPPRAMLMIPLILGQTGINQFLRRFLQVHLSSNRVDRILSFWVWLIPLFGIPMLFLTWFGPPGMWRIYARVMPILGMANMLMLLYVVAKRGLTGYVPARIALVGFLAFSGCTTVTALGAQGWLPYSGAGILVEVGLACDALALSVGLAYAARLADRRNAALKKAADRFVPYEFLQKLKRDDITEVSHGDQLETDMTVFFSDIRSFTTVVEGLSPEETIEFVNEHLHVMEAPIQNHGGFIDKFIGDAVMALFDSPDAALKAVAECQAALDADNEKRAERGLAPVAAGIGLHHGKVMLGTVGGKDRLSCTVLGDTVNLAARIEGMTKIYGARALVTQAVVDAASDEASSLRRLDVVAVKGKTEPVAVFEVIDAQGPPEREARLKTREQMERGVRLYIDGKPEDSLGIIREVREMDPSDEAASLFESRCQQMIESGVPEDWDGVTRMTTK